MTYHVISLVIISNNFPLSPPISFTYFLVPDGSFIQYTSPSSYCSFDSYSSISCLLGFNLFYSDHLTEPCNWQRPIKQNQLRIVLALGEYDSSSKHKHCILGTSVTRPRCMVRWTQQSTAPWCLFDTITREVCSTDVTLEHLLLEATGKRLGKEEAQFNCFDGSCIRSFGNARHQGYDKTWWRDPLSGVWWNLVVWLIKWNLRIGLKGRRRLGLKARPDGIV